jgi:hypothetical protein
MKIRLRLDTDESKERWELIKEASAEVSEWDELRKAEAYRRTKVDTMADSRDEKVSFSEPAAN